ncbi:Rossmann-fold NAD(P)-binding domain-containing protein [Halorarum salinum]|nr:hypothetical protein [Halobaculum salinum]
MADEPDADVQAVLDRLTGDVDSDSDSAREKASVLSPSPYCVGPMARTMRLVNTVEAAAALTDTDVLPSPRRARRDRSPLYDADATQR